MKFLRLIPRFLLVSALFIGTLLASAYGYVASGLANARIGSRLEAAVGMPVQVRSAGLNLSSLSLGDVAICARPEEQSAPWMKIGSLSADVSPWQLLVSDAAPSQVALSDVAIKLNFGPDGRLLTPLPAANAGALPACRLVRGQVAVCQEGRPDLILTGVEAHMVSDADSVVLTGTVTDDKWGNWGLTLRLDRPSSRMTLNLKTPQVRVDRQMLESLPFVPAKTWKQVQVEDGDTGVEITVGLAPSAPCTYRVELQVRNTTLDVTAIKLHAEQTSGSVIVENGEVHLRSVTGTTADGTLRTDSDMDFRGNTSELKFNGIALQGINLQKLPPTWNLPRFITGDIAGSADLHVTVSAEGKPITTGKGEGTVNNARVLGFPREPLRLTMTASEKGFQFQPLGKPSSHLMDQHAALALLTSAVLAPAPAAASPPDWVVEQVGTGLLSAGKAVSTSVRIVTSAVRPFSNLPAPPTGPAPTYLDADLNLQDVDLAQLLEGLKITAPISGRGTFTVHIGIPVDNSTDLKLYRLKGTARLPWARVAGLQVQKVTAEINYRDGLARLEKLTGTVPGGRPPEAIIEAAGTFNGDATVQVVPSGDLEVGLELHNLPIHKLLAIVPQAPSGSGAVSGRVRGLVSLTKLTDPTAWGGTGQLQTDRAVIDDWEIATACTHLRVRNGKLFLTRASAEVQGAPLSSDATVQLVAPYAYDAQVTVEPGEKDVTHLPIPLPAGIAVAGKFDVTADLDGTLMPLTAHGSGTGAAEVLNIADLRFDGLTFRWGIDKDRVTLTDLKVTYDKGELTGRGTVPLRPSLAGDIRLNFDNLDMTALNKEVKAIPFRIDGTVSGSVVATIPTAGEDGERKITTHLEMTSPRLRVRGIPTSRLKGDVDYRNGELEYNLEGAALGGKFDLNGKIPLKSEKPGALNANPMSDASCEALPAIASDKVSSGDSSIEASLNEAMLTLAPLLLAPDAGLPGQGRIHIEGVRLSMLGEALRLERPLPLAGRFDFDLTYRPGPDGVSVGRGNMRLRNFKWDDTILAGDLQADVGLAGSRVRINNFSGQFAQGAVLGVMVYDLRRPARSWFTINLQGAEATRLLAPFGLGDQVTGPIEARLRGTFGQEIDAHGMALLARGAVAGVAVTDWRMPIHFAFTPGSGRGEIEVRDSSAQVGSGRARGQVSYSWGEAARLEGNVRFLNADMNALGRSLGSLNEYASGRTSGHFDFSGNNVRSIDDVTGLLEASFQQTQALNLPVLRQLVPFVLPGGAASTTFQSGDLKARLGNGTWRIEHARLVGSFLQMVIEGRVTTEGRLDLDVTTSTNLLGFTSPALRNVGLRLPTVGPLPVVLLIEASNLLSARVLYLRVTGTIRSPNIRVEPLRVLTDEAARFFLSIVTGPLPVGVSP